MRIISFYSANTPDSIWLNLAQTWLNMSQSGSNLAQSGLIWLILAQSGSKRMVCQDVSTLFARKASVLAEVESLPVPNFSSIGRS